MKKRLYPRLAWQGIRKNGKIYFPYLAACIFVVMVYYLIGFLSSDPVIREMEGGAQMQIILSLGTGVMGIFSVIFLFYTNSFLMKRRKKELGLYHVLGMDRKNIAVVLIWENLMTAGISLGGGILGGILFSKLGQLAMIYLLGGKADFSFSINSDILIRTLKTYGVIFLLLLAYRILQIFRTRPLELLKSESLGERPPRANWLSTILGAVLMVIGATYLLFMAGSVTLCKVLKKNKKYYYKTNHFVSLSSMMFRMKRNGAGLASICILSTMVLVMVSGTVSLFLGTEDSLRSRYPRNLVVNTPSLEDGVVSQVNQIVEGALEKYGVREENVLHYRQLVMSGMAEGNRMILDYANSGEFSYTEYENVRQIMVVPVEDYNRIMGTDETQSLIAQEISAGLQSLGEQDPAFSGTTVECVGVERMDFYSTYAGLFFLGILLGIVFLLGMVLIMYYKQVSEGYEDQSRFEILQKVGMTEREIRKSVNSQVLTVFFMPLIWAGIHTAFAFPMIYRLLQLFSLHNMWLLIGITGGCFLGFGLVYVLMYLLTSKSYYKIVRGGSFSSRRQRG